MVVKLNVGTFDDEKLEANWKTMLDELRYNMKDYLPHLLPSC